MLRLQLTAQEAQRSDSSRTQSTPRGPPSSQSQRPLLPPAKVGTFPCQVQWLVAAHECPRTCQEQGGEGGRPGEIQVPAGVFLSESCPRNVSFLQLVISPGGVPGPLRTTRKDRKRQAIGVPRHPRSRPTKGHGCLQWRPLLVDGPA